ncbi:hypothetical protein D3C85_427260 [compost metagenome]
MLLNGTFEILVKACPFGSIRNWDTLLLELREIPELCCMLKNKNNPLFIPVFCYIWWGYNGGFFTD